MKQRISTILCVILLALQIGALVKAEETVSGNEPPAESEEVSKEEEMLGNGIVFSTSEASDPDPLEIVIGEEEQGGAEDKDSAGDGGPSVSGNDAGNSEDSTAVSDNDAGDGDDAAVSDEDAEASDIDSAISDEDDIEVSGNDPDGMAESDDRLDSVFSSEDIIIVDGKPMVDTDGDGIPDEELDAAEYEKLLEAASEDNLEETVIEDDLEKTVSSDDPAETVSGDDLEEAVDYAARNILSLQIPRNLNFVIDPWEIGEKGSVWSADHVFSNRGTAPVKLTLKNIKCEVREGITCLGKQYGADAAAKASGKAAWLQLVLGNGDVIHLTEEGSSYEVIIGAGESISMAVKGAVSNPKTELWQDGDISVSLTYGAAVCAEEEK